MNFFAFNLFKTQSIRFATRSSGWSKLRKQHLSSNPCCAACGNCKKVEVHHIEPVHLSPEKELDIDNLITLCDDPCHLLFGHLMDYKSWNKDVEQDCNNFYNKILDRPYKK
jgi:5-methylcytosine-specific restriction endonuclease McrA